MSEPPPPLSVNNIVYASLRKLLQNFRTVLGIGLIFHAPYSALMGILFYIDEQRIEKGFAAPICGDGTFSAEILLSSFALSLVSGLILYPLAYVATAFAIDDSYQNRPASLRSCLSRTFKRLGALVSAVGRLAIQLFFAFLCFIIPGIYLWVKYCLTYQVVALENEPGETALLRSEELTKGKMLIAFAVIMVPHILAIFIGLFESTAITLMWVVVNTITGTLIGVFSSITNAVLYQTYRAQEQKAEIDVGAGELSGG